MVNEMTKKDIAKYSEEVNSIVSFEELGELIKLNILKDKNIPLLQLIKFDAMKDVFVTAYVAGEDSVANDKLPDFSQVKKKFTIENKTYTVFKFCFQSREIGYLVLQFGNNNSLTKDFIEEIELICLLSSGAFYSLCMSQMLVKYEENSKIQERALEWSGNGIVITDALTKDNEIIYVNKAFEDITGYSKAEMLGRNCRVLQGEDHNQEELFRISAAIKESKSCSVKLRNYKKDGTMFWNELKISPIKNSQEITTHFIGIQNDISERIRKDEEIKKLKEFYEELLNDLPGQIAVFDTDFRYMYVNPASVTNDEVRKWLIGKNDFKYCEYRNIDPGQAERRTKMLKEVIETRTTLSFEEKFVKPGKEECHYLRVIYPIPDVKGNVSRLLAYGVDITERKKTENELQRLTILLKSVLETTAEGIVTVDRFSKIKMVNKEAEKIFGYTTEELMGENLTILMPKQFRKMHNSGMNRYLETRIPKVLEKKLELVGLHKSGREFPIEITIMETRIGEELNFTAAIHDISEQKELLEKLKNSNQSLSEFAYIASHDLREPLRKIISFGELLELSLGESLPEDDKENLSFMIDGATRMQNMINDLLSYSRITASINEFHSVNVDEIVDELIHFELAELIAENEATVIRDQTLGTIKGEKTRIKRLFQNLISNGIKYHKIDVKPVVKIRRLKHYDNFMFEIEDNGIGIEEKFHAKIFEMFKRLHSREEYSGSGIGLSICKKIVDNLGGEIRVDSVPGNGSKFILSIPDRNG